MLFQNNSQNLINKKFGKIVKFGIVKYAPAGIDDEQLLKDGWLPVDDFIPQSDDPEYAYVTIGWFEDNGYIRRKTEKRKRVNFRRKYAKEKIIEAMGKNYELFIQKLKIDRPALFVEFEKSTVYYEGCGTLHQLEKMYCEMFNVELSEVRHLILEPAEIKSKKEKAK